MHYFTKATLAAGLFLMSSSNLMAQLTGTVTVPSGLYPTLASVVTALNAQGVGSGGVVINLTASNPQTAPIGGYLLGSATLNGSTSATNTVTINGNGNTVTANVGTSTATDGIFIIQGVDNLAINGLNLAESATNIVPLTQMEWGYALVKRNAATPFDGCQNVRIQNCTVTLNKANTASVGIYAGNHLAASTAQLTITAATDANSNNLVYGNTTQNCYTGISFTGATGTAFYDIANEIGNTVAGNGNIIQNFGGGAVAQTGIVASNQGTLVIGGNTINNTAGGGSAGGNATLTGIYFMNTGSANVSNNIITLQQGTTGNSGAVTAISSNTVGTPLNVTISGNTISGTGGGTGTWYGIDLAGLNPTLTVSTNTFKDINLSTTALAHLIHQTAVAVPVTLNITGNVTAGTTTPYIQKAAGSNFAFYFNTVASANTNTNISGNTVTQILLSGATTCYGIYAYDVTTSGIKNVFNNTISNIAGGTSAMYPLAASNGATSNVYNNVISNVSGGGIIYCINLMSNGTANVYNNKVTGMNGASTNATVYGAYCNSATGTFNLYNNFFTDLTAPATSSNTGVNGIYGAAGTVNAYNNTIVIGKLGAITGGANFSCAGVYSSSPLNLKNNIIYVNATPTGTGNAACVKRNTVANPVGSPPAISAFAADNNIYYINPGAQSFVYVEGITVATSKNGYGVSGLTASTANNIVNDAQFNRTCGAYKTFMTANGEQNSYYENNVTALTAGTYAPTGSTYAESGGANIALVTTDYAGAARSTPPDIGALQFTGTQIPVAISPSITYTQLADRTICAATATLTAVINGGGTNTINTTTASPRVYYKKTTEANVFGTYPADNVATFNGWKYVSATGTAPNFSFTFDYTLLSAPLAVNDTIQYFVVAEDNATVPNATISVAGFTNLYCLTGVNILPAAGGVATVPAVNRFIILPPPAFTINESRDSLCKDEIHAISVTSPVVNYSSYIWSPTTNLYTDAAATIAYTGTSVSSVYVKSATGGTTVYTATASNGTTQCVVTRTDSIIVLIVDTAIAGAHNFCDGDSATLVAAPGNAYQWQNNGVAITGATSSDYVVRNTGSYRVVITNTHGCTDTSRTYSVTNNPLPTPTITLAGTTLSTGSFVTYQWTLNSVDIPGATTQSISYVPGAYTVTVTDAAGCKGTSPVFFVQQGVGTVGNNPDIKIYPNPVQNELNIKSLTPVNASICSMDGRVLIQENNAVRVNVSSLPVGMYMIRITDKSNRLLSVEKLLKKD